ncbi:hypothetical protein [Elizabethkingia sp. JS20170427COW]|uniref:hypothetical protein n=1 Tax=Elizabethkingia sp. JS20170427COW TaxID=2583851 RepID=UPI0011109524|nr:hypothetical protein [Elizabethkingia sp. JS20170427COW]QCX53358.1 hypothetical protein FGE20_06215 [Elizabethkingia sp. JS20170427COW]
MKKASLILIIATLLSFLYHHYISSFGNWEQNLFYAFAFGLGWAMAYLLDTPQLSMPKKLGTSFIGMIILLVIGFAFFNFEIAVPSLFRFSIVFVTYYLLASFKASKSLRR